MEGVLDVDARPYAPRFREEAREARERSRLEEFTEREMKILEKGGSNFEFHYLGCAKIMAQIGQGFAEAMAGVNENY